MPQAEEAGRRAAGGAARVPWAVHAVAHVMEMQGRFEEGAAWLRQHAADWADDNGFAGHLWWHLGAVPPRGAGRAGRAAPASMRICQRPRAAGHAAARSTRRRCCGACTCWATMCAQRCARSSQAGTVRRRACRPLRLQRPARACWRWLAPASWRAPTPGSRAAPAVRSTPPTRGAANHTMAREIGAAADARRCWRYARGDHDAAAELMQPARSAAQRFGGSHAQRDLIDQTLLAACALRRQRSRARPRARERAAHGQAGDAADPLLGPAAAACRSCLRGNDAMPEPGKLIDDRHRRAPARAARASGELRSRTELRQARMQFDDGYDDTPAELRMGDEDPARRRRRCRPRSS